MLLKEYVLRSTGMDTQVTYYLAKRRKQTVCKDYVPLIGRQAIQDGN